jgi:hypothetical protein
MEKVPAGFTFGYISRWFSSANDSTNFDVPARAQTAGLYVPFFPKLFNLICELKFSPRICKP